MGGVGDDVLEEFAELALATDHGCGTTTCGWVNFGAGSCSGGIVAAFANAALCLLTIVLVSDRLDTDKCGSWTLAVRMSPQGERTSGSRMLSETHANSNSKLARK